MLQYILDKFKSIKLLNKKYRINDKIYFKNVLYHPVTKDRIEYGIIRNIKENLITLYLYDGIDITDTEYCGSWIKNFTKEELEKNIK